MSRREQDVEMQVLTTASNNNDEENLIDSQEQPQKYTDKKWRFTTAFATVGFIFSTGLYGVTWLFGSRQKVVVESEDHPTSESITTGSGTTGVVTTGGTTGSTTGSEPVDVTGPVTFDFVSPMQEWEDGYFTGVLFINNQRKSKISIERLEFDSNVNITYPTSGNFTSTNVTINRQLKDNNIAFRYFVEFEPPVDIQSLQSRTLVYNETYTDEGTETLGPIKHLAMNPTNVAVKLENSSSNLNVTVNGFVANSNRTQSVQIAARIYNEDEYDQWTYSYPSTQKHVVAAISKLNNVIYKSFIVNPATGEIFSWTKVTDNSLLYMFGIGRLQRDGALKVIVDLIPNASTRTDGFSSGCWEPILANQTSRANFLGSVNAVVEQCQADGVHIYPYTCYSWPAKPVNYTDFAQFLSEINNVLDGKIVATSVRRDVTIPQDALCDIANNTQQMHIYTTGYNDNWPGDNSAYRAPIDEVVQSIENYLALDCIKSEQLGIRFSSYIESMNVPNVVPPNYGWNETILSYPPAQFDNPRWGNYSSGVWNYECLMLNTSETCGPWRMPPADLVFLNSDISPDPSAKQSWFYSSQQHLVATGEDVRSVIAKTQLAAQYHLGYVELTDLVQDVTADNELSLLKNMYDTSEQLDQNNSTSSKKDISFEDHQQSNQTSKVSELPQKVVELFDQFFAPYPEVYKIFAKALAQGGLLICLQELSNGGLTKLLKHYGYSDWHISCANTVFNELIHFAITCLVAKDFVSVLQSSIAFGGLRLLCRYGLGYSSTATNVMLTTTNIEYQTRQSPIQGEQATAAALGGLMAGIGFFACKKIYSGMRNYFNQQPEVSAIETNHIPQASM